MSCSLIVKEKVCLVQMVLDVCKHVPSIFFFSFSVCICAFAGK